jgi:hypothetical protein
VLPAGPGAVVTVFAVQAVRTSRANAVEKRCRCFIAGLDGYLLSLIQATRFE